MKVSTRWLKEYVKHNYNPSELAQKLTMTGSEVEQIIDIGQKIAGVVVGKIEEINKHDNADNLLICSVNVGQQQLLDIVTHAPNVKEDCYVPVACVGAVLPGGMEVKEVTFRGVKSRGMLCSEAELGLGEDTSGIMILPHDLTPGSDLIDALDAKDTVIDFEITPNRPDCLSMLGIAREVSAICQEPVIYPKSTLKESADKANSLINIVIEDKDLCPRYCGRIITNVKIGPSPAWLQKRLRAGGMRPINNIVDITNYCLLEYGQPLHAFDYDLIRGKEIIVRRAKEGESITSLDGQERTLDREFLAICDKEGPVAIGGVMGGLESEVTERTTSILLESANFDPVSIRRTSQKLAIRTEASSRFEKGLDVQGVVEPLNRAAFLMQELAGGQVLSGLLDEGLKKSEDRVITISVERINNVLGSKIDSSVMENILRSLDFDATVNGDAIKVKPPYFRKDISIEADIIEEIARIYGYNKIEATLPHGRIISGGVSKGLKVSDDTRDILNGLGLA